MFKICCSIIAIVLSLASSAAHAQGVDEYLDPFVHGRSAPTQLAGLHACDGPHLMSGVQIARNELLCLGVQGAVAGDVFRTINTGMLSTVDGVQMRTCPREFAMKGIWANPLFLMCSQVSNLGPVHADHNTQRQNMHACPPGEIMVGINTAQNVLACAMPPS